MKNWQLAIGCILLAIVIFQSVLIQDLNSQIIAIQTQTSRYHAETLARLTALQAGEQRIEAQIKALRRQRGG